jgi:hypothetical protein
MNCLFKDLCREFGVRTLIAGPIIGIYIYRNLIKEERRLAAGWKYEPASFYERNAAAIALESRTSKTFTPINSPANIHQQHPNILSDMLPTGKVLCDPGSTIISNEPRQL